MKRTFAFQLRCLPLLGMFVGLLFAGASGCAGDLDPSINQTGTAGTQGQSGTSGGAGTTGTAGTGGGCLPATRRPWFSGTNLNNGGCANPLPPHRCTGRAARAWTCSRLAWSPGCSTRDHDRHRPQAPCMAAAKPYLSAAPTRPTGLLIDKIDQKLATVTCGSIMPQSGSSPPLSRSASPIGPDRVTTGAITSMRHERSFSPSARPCWSRWSGRWPRGRRR